MRRGELLALADRCEAAGGDARGWHCTDCSAHYVVIGHDLVLMTKGDQVCEGILMLERGSSIAAELRARALQAAV